MTAASTFNVVVATLTLARLYCYHFSGYNTDTLEPGATVVFVDTVTLTLASSPLFSVSLLWH